MVEPQGTAPWSTPLSVRFNDMSVFIHESFSIVKTFLKEGVGVHNGRFITKRNQLLVNLVNLFHDIIA